MCVGEMESGPAILIYAEGLVCPPQKATAEERAEQDDAVIPLWLGTGHLQLVEKPVEVEERGGQFVQDKGGGVIVDEGSLSLVSNDWTSDMRRLQGRSGGVQNPRRKLQARQRHASTSPDQRCLDI